MKAILNYDNLRTPLANYPVSPTITKYKEIMIPMMKMNFPLLSDGELAAAIDDSISRHFQDADVVIDNNYKKKKVDMTVRSLADYIISKEPIITSYGVLFNRHGTMPNPVYHLIDGFISARKVLKKEMFKYPKGSEDFEKYNLLQLLAKIDANGCYGATGQHSCIYYNLYTASSVTRQGKSCNSTAALFFESFLNNNVPFGSLNELMEFIHNVIHLEKRHYNSYNIITNHASIEECFFKLMSSTGFGWTPSEDEMHIVWEVLCKLDQDNLDRLFYKNNLFHFIDNAPIKQAILYLLQTLKAPFLDPNEPPEEILEALKEFCDVLKEYVYYGFQIIDKIEKMTSMIRSVSIIQDTDSAIVSFDGWYRYVREMCVGIPMAIKNEVVDAAEFADGNMEISEPIQKVDEYSFVNDDIIEVDRLIDPMVIIPQDGLRYSIINILAYCIGILVNDYMERYCDNAHSTNERACLISLKNEFLFRRVLITDAKKHYASKMELQEGNRVPEEKSLDIKGMDAFVKSSTNVAVQKRLKAILYDDILNTETIDQIQILRDIAKVEKEIFDSINAGKKEFFKPVKVKSLSSYENPMRIQGITASHAYNALHEPGTEALDLSIRNSVDVVKVDMNMKNIDRIRETFPGVYERAIELMKTREYSTGINSIAIPLNEPLPGWILPFIEYSEIIKDNVSGFPIESVGLFRGNPYNNSTNIIRF